MRHPANLRRWRDRDRGQRAADRVTGYMGSWRFIALQTAVIAAWTILNSCVIALQWDPYPWILLNLVFSTQAAYASPLILLAQNRQAEHDRETAEHDFAVNTESLELIRAIHAHTVTGQPGGQDTAR
jgi:uncharacterized membrane protein